MDGVDTAVVELLAEDGGLRGALLDTATVPYTAELRAALGRAVAGEPLDAAEVCLLDTELGAAYGRLAAEAGAVDLVASMGQTLYHWIEDGTARGTLQLGQPAWIAERTGTPVVSDFRPRDVAAGGQGAPLVPILDELLLRGLGSETVRATVNIGGIANITVVAPGAPTIGYDTGPGNALLDAAWEQRGDRSAPYDKDAAVAATGTVHEAMLRELRADPYFARRPPKSTGKEYFTARMLEPYGGLPLPDVLATLTELTAWHIAEACATHDVRDVLLCGGGAANPLLRERLHLRLEGTATVRDTGALGVPPDAKEAVLAGLLGWLTWHGVGGNVPSATGARGTRVLGSITPGGAPLRLPAPLREAPAWVQFTRDEGGGR